MNKTKGITLIALIITIIIMLILVSVTVTMAINGGLFGKAGEAVFKQMMTGYQEKVGIYTAIQIIEDTEGVNAGATDLEPKVEMSEILGGEEVKKAYVENIAVENGELYYVPTDNSKRTKQEVSD